MPESYTARINRKKAKKKKIIEAASGRVKADLVLKNATYINVFTDTLETADIAIAQGQIVGIGEYHGTEEVDAAGKIVCPGLIDAHIHLESAIVMPHEFVRAVLPHGTTTVITDPHEIANVMGSDGIEFMLEATEGLPVDVRFTLPSCVPATPLDESGAKLDYRSIDSFYDHPRVVGLAEMMDFVGISSGNDECVEKVVAAQAHHQRIDGHAPGLTGKTLNAYISAGVYTDHECATLEEAMEKLSRGQYIMIREGTAAHNLAALLPLLKERYANRCMFCSDDRHPSDLLEKGHIDSIVRQAIEAGVDPITAVKTASHHAAVCFHLNNRGAIAPGYLADLVLVDDLQSFQVQSVYKSGVLVYDGEVTEVPEPEINDFLLERAHDTFHVAPLTAASFALSRPRAVMGIVPGELLTTDEGYAEAVSIDDDILKIAVIERHRNTNHIGICYLHGYRLKEGAVATSVSHDSHNIIVVGASDEDMARAANRIIEMRGGIVVTRGGETLGEVSLPIAGIMSESPLAEVNDALENAKEQAFSLGVSREIDPFMTLSFLALPVIPEIRLTTRGVFDLRTQSYI